MIVAEREELLGEEDDEEDDDENLMINDKNKEESGKDPILQTIGDFGPYQFFICVVGYFVTIPHCWISLSLKFVGMRTNFTCADHFTPNISFDESCVGPDQEKCLNFIFDQSQFRSTIHQRWNLVCDQEGMDSIAQSVFFSGCLIGVFFSGVLADIYGRKPVFFSLVAGVVIFGVMGGITSSFYTWLVLRFLLGASAIGMITVRFTIQVEMVGSKWRTWGNMTGALGWSSGYMLLPVIVYLIPDMKKLEVFIALCFLPFLGLYWIQPESPKWLLSVGRIDEAQKIVERISYWNSKPFKGIRGQGLSSSSSTETHVPGLLSILQFPNIGRNLLCMSFSWFSVGLVYYGIALHTPEFGSNVYMVFFLAGLIEIPANLISPYLMNRFGRKRLMIVGFLFTSGSLLLAPVIPHGMFAKEWLTVTIITLSKLWIGFCFECCYIWSSEIFPTVIRNSSLSLCSSSARLGAIISPLLVELDKEKPMLPVLIYGVLAFISALTVLYIHPETKDCENLPNSLEEGEFMATRKKKNEEEKKGRN